MATATAPPPNPINTPMTYQQLQDLAASQAAATIAGENAPLTAQVGTLGSQETAAAGNINSMFGQILPYVQQSAQAVQQAQDWSTNVAAQVFAAAGTRMNQLKQQQASEAQQLAQQMGGPVSAGDFTQGVDPYMSALPGEQGAGMMGALSIGLANTQEAQQFAGQVFPALQTEQVAKSDSYYRDQIKTLQDQITQNEAGKSDLVNKNLADLLDKERTFQLNINQAKLDKTKAARDWKVQQQQIKSSKLSGQLSAAAAKRAGIQLGITAARTKAEIQHMTTADKLAAGRLGLSQQEFLQRKQHQAETAKIGAAKVSDSISKDAASVVEAAMGGGKPVSMTHRAYIPKTGAFAFKAPPGAFWDPQKKQYYKVVHETMTPGEWQQASGMGATGTHITDPNRLYDLVRGTIPQLGRKATINLIRAQTGMKGWAPGKKMNYGSNELHGMPTGMLVGVARDAGYPGVLGKQVNRQRIIDWLLHVNPGPNPNLGAGGPGTNP